jgi:CheY-like chemotaxis protein
MSEDREWFMAGGWEARAPGERALRVLVVDDNQDAADSLCALLRAWGYDFRTAYDGKAGWEAALEYRPDCVVLDIAMPGLDGYALARRLRQQAGLEQTKLVALTAFSDEAHARRAQEAGFDYHLVKPADPTDVERLLHMINEVYKLASRTEDLAKQNVALASETKELLKEVKEDIREVKEEVKELKQELREVKDMTGQDRKE